jgi:hypothetical protein
MNPQTLVVVHAYEGDAHQVEHALKRGLYLNHGCPVLILSPEDAPVNIEMKGVECRQAGRAQYWGQASLDRQRAHLEILRDDYKDFEWFLLNDSDSFCLEPVLPAFLYDDPNVIWSNIVEEGRDHTSPYPKIAFHPPYFLGRQALERLLTAADKPEVTAHEITPFIDWYMVALACESGTPYKSFEGLGTSFPAWKHNPIPETKQLGQRPDHKNDPGGKRDGGWKMARRVQLGAIFIHSVKHPEVVDRLITVHSRRSRRSS